VGRIDALLDDALLPRVGVGVEGVAQLLLDRAPITSACGSVPYSSAIAVYSACAHSSYATSVMNPVTTADVDEPS